MTTVSRTTLKKEPYNRDERNDSMLEKSYLGCRDKRKIHDGQVNSHMCRDIDFLDWLQYVTNMFRHNDDT
jgi:hypothetical protein